MRQSANLLFYKVFKNSDNRARHFFCPYFCRTFVRMKKILRHIAVYGMVATVWVATTGLSVHHLYCYCKGEAVTSLFRPTDSCEAEPTAKSCCKSKTCGGENLSTQKHNCTDCTSVFVKLDVKYLPSFLDLKLQDFSAPQSPQFITLHSIFFEKNAPHWAHDLPPPPAGKALLPWIQSFLC